MSARAATMPHPAPATATARATGERPVPALTGRQLAVIGHAAAGLAIREIATAMGITRSAVRSAIEDAGYRLGVRGIVAEVGALVQLGLLAIGPAAAPAPPRPALDPWERRVVALLADGQTEKTIARTLGKPRFRVNNTVTKLYARLGVHTHAALVHRAAILGAYPEPELA